MIDFCDVAPQHAQVHAELENWARWCEPRRRGGLGMAPMFRNYRPPAGYKELHPPQVVDSLAAVATQKRFVRLPEQNRHALCWAYVYPWVSPFKCMRMLAIQRARLVELVQQGRQMMRGGTE